MGMKRTNNRYSLYKNQKLIQGFYFGDKEVIRMRTPQEYASTKSFRNVLKVTIKRLGVPVIVRVIDGWVYLIKEPV